jgi:transcriptional regulator with XRE-family HTH domain
MDDGITNRHVAQRLLSGRLAQGISLGDLARRIGYCNVAKGSNRIQSFERTGVARSNDLPRRIAEVLGVGDEELRRVAWLDYLEWQRWLNEPVPMELIVRLMAAIYCRECLPEELTPVEAEQFAAQVARDRQRQVCLVASRRLSIYFDEQGNVIARNEVQPFVQIGGKRFLFDGRWLSSDVRPDADNRSDIPRS